MPSPLGHALGGLIVGLAGAAKEEAPEAGARAARAGWSSLRVPLICAAAAALPDIDFFWGRHNMETHSLGAAVLAGLVVLAWTKGREPRLALLVTLAWVSHTLFDWLGSDTTPPLGVMALWPLTSEFFFAHAYVFEAISRRTHLPGFWAHNLKAVAWEVAMLAPIAAGLAWVRWRLRTNERRDRQSRSRRYE